MNAIGIDIGTTSVCGVMIDTVTGELKKSRTENSNSFIDGCADWEKIQSVDKIINLATEILESLVDKDTAVIGVTGQMHGIVYTDTNGEAVSPLYTWQDGRGNLPYGDTTYADYLKSHTGYGNVTDFYNRENGIRPGTAVSYCTIHDYFVMKLCGLKKPIIHSSDAASFGCYDLTENKFSYNCDAEITADYKIAGGYKKIPVAVAIGDNQASVFSTLTDEGRVLINIGTGSQVSVISDAIINGENIETRPYFDNKYLVVGSALCGGRAYSMLRSFYSDIIGRFAEVNEDDVYNIMGEMAERAKDGLTVDTRFAGTRNNPSVTGSITGITTQNFTPDELTLGVLNGIADELYAMYKEMQIKRCGIAGSGNGIRKNPVLINIFENRFKGTMQIPLHTEEASVGAALFAMVAGGICNNAKSAQELIKYI